MKKTIIVVGGGTTGALVCGLLTTINCDIINIRTDVFIVWWDHN